MKSASEKTLLVRLKEIYKAGLPGQDTSSLSGALAANSQTTYSGLVGTFKQFNSTNLNGFRLAKAALSAKI